MTPYMSPSCELCGLFCAGDLVPALWWRLPAHSAVVRQGQGGPSTTELVLQPVFNPLQKMTSSSPLPPYLTAALHSSIRRLISTSAEEVLFVCSQDNSG